MGGDIGINVGVNSISFEEQIGSKKYFLLLDSSTSQCLTSASKSSNYKILHCTAAALDQSALQWFFLHFYSAQYQ